MADVSTTLDCAETGLVQPVVALVNIFSQVTKPIPVLKDIFYVTNFIITSAGLFKSNREEWRNLADFLISLCKELEEIAGEDTPADGLDSELSQHLKGILCAIESIRVTVKKLQKRRLVQAILHIWDDKNTIAGFRQSLDDAWKKFMIVQLAETCRGVDDLNRKLEQHRIIMPSPAVEHPPMPPPTKECPRPVAFTGRETLLSELLEYFAPRPSQRGSRIAVLTGLGGVGKSQIAYRLAELIQDNDCPIKIPEVYYVDASSEPSILADMKNIAVSMRWGKTVIEAMTGLQSRTNPWLLIFDNADCEGLDMRLCIPQASNGNIIITSRNVEMRVLSPRGHYQVPCMDEIEAVELLARYVPEGGDRAALGGLAAVLGYLPLSLVQASTYIQAMTPECTVENYLKIITEHPKRFINSSAMMMYQCAEYKGTAYATWNTSFKQLTPDARMFLALCSHLHHDNIPIDMFSRAGKSVVEVSSSPLIPEDPIRGFEYLKNFLEGFLTIDGHWDTASFLEVTRGARRYSFLEFNTTDQSYTMNPTLHRWIREEAHSEEIQVAAQYLCAFAIEDPKFRRRMVPHIIASLSNSDSVAIGDDLILRFCRALRETGRFTKAKELCDIAVQARQQKFGLQDLQTAEALAEKAWLLEELGQYEEGLQCATEVLELRTARLEEKHKDTVDMMARVASVSWRLGRYEEALQMQEIVLAARIDKLGEYHPDTLSAVGYVTISLNSLRRHEEEMEFTLKVLRIRRKLLGDDHPDTICAVASMACVSNYLGCYEDADPMEQEVLEGNIERFGQEHPETLSAMATRASNWRNCGRYAEAEEMEEKLLEMRMRLDGPEHAETIATMADLVCTRCYLGKYKTAEEMEEEVLKLLTKDRGRDHPDTLTSMASLACIRRKLGRYLEARKTEEEVLLLQRMALGPEHPDVIQTMANLACTLGYLGEYEEQENLERDVLELRSKVLGSDHADTSRTKANLACARRDFGRFEEAIRTQNSKGMLRRDIGFGNGSI